MDGEEVKRDTVALCRWYEESPNVTSSTRVFTAILVGFDGVVLMAMIAYGTVCAIRHDKPDANIVASLVGAVVAISGNIAANVATRNKGV